MATDYPVTMAIRSLRQHKADFTPHLYTWESRGGTRASAEHLGCSGPGCSKSRLSDPSV